MAILRSRDARLFYRCAFQRYEEAKVLFTAGYTTGSVYLAGYSIECILKALILAALPHGRAADVLRTFRGRRAHDYEWLRTRYLTNGGARFPREVNQHFTLVNDWSTELRYTPRSLKPDEADSFLVAAVAIVKWADGRL